MSNPKPITRFAPSPNGRLHMGHAYSALLNQKLAGDGTFLLRIEDIDLGRRQENLLTRFMKIYTGLGCLGPRQ